MFREMRRKRQQLTEAENIAILERESSGVLAVLGDEGYPYAVPLSYVYQDGKLFFHCAKTGHKLDAIRREPKASFCVIDQDQVVAEEYTTYFRSVIAFGRVRILTDEAEIAGAARDLGVKYAPEDSREHLEAVIARDAARLCMFVLEIEHLTGKEAKELVQARGR